MTYEQVEIEVVTSRAVFLIEQEDFDVLEKIVLATGQAIESDSFGDYVIRVGDAYVKKIESENDSTFSFSPTYYTAPAPILGLTKETIFDDVCELLNDHLQCSDKTLTMQTKIVGDLGADSLDVVELVMALEDDYGIEITDDDAEDMSTIGDVVHYLNEHPMWIKK